MGGGRREIGRREVHLDLDFGGTQDKNRQRGQSGWLESRSSVLKCVAV